MNKELKKLLMQILCPDILGKNEELELEISDKKEELSELQAKYLIEIRDLREIIENLIEEKESHEENYLYTSEDIDRFVLEYFWNNKRSPKKTLYYPAREGKNMNVLRFLTSNNDKVPEVNGVNSDTKANNALKWVKNNVTYTSDKKTSGRDEQWQFANETLESKKGDCEDGAILMANVMLASGVPYWRIRLNAGSVQGGGHAYLTYLKEEDNKWYVMDWCYWYPESVNFKKRWSSAKKYFGIWFSWNNIYGFKESTLDKEE